MGEKVTFKIVSEDNFDPDISENKPALVNGQLIFVPGDNGFGKIYLDYKGTRTCYTPEGGSGGASQGALNYIGISTTDPTKGVTIDGSPYTKPNLNDMVVWEKKEYMYRAGENGTGWYELGDEDAPEWET